MLYMCFCNQKNNSKKRKQLSYAGILVTLILAISGCATNMPEYISCTSSGKISEVVSLFNKDMITPYEEYSGVYILPVEPEKYYEQNVPYCGGFSIAGILSAYQMDGSESASEHMSLLGRLIGGMGPADMIYSLEKSGLEGTINRANKLSDSAKIDLLKDEINKGYPVLLLVGNGYNKDGTYSGMKSQGLTHLHWITLWGYHTNGFFIYDSVVHPYQYEPVPIGNVERSNKEILRDWICPFYLSPFLGNTYIVLGDKGAGMI